MLEGEQTPALLLAPLSPAPPAQRVPGVRTVDEEARAGSPAGREGRGFGVVPRAAQMCGRSVSVTVPRAGERQDPLLLVLAAEERPLFLRSQLAVV